MTESPIRYRLIKTEKHTGGSFRRNHYTTWNISDTDVYASRNTSYC